MSRYHVACSRIPLWLLGLLALAGVWGTAATVLAEETKPAVLVIRLPADARLEIDDTPTNQEGAVRRFESPPLTVGQTYTYTVRATWEEDGERRTVVRKAQVTPGEETEVDLRPPTLGMAPWGPGVQSGNSIVAVDNGTATDAVVKVIRLNGEERMVRNFYVPHGKQFSAEKIPPGRYVLRVAFGIDWDATARKFSADRSFSETEAFDVTEEETAGEIIYSRITITLHKVVDGNFKSDPIDEDAFSRTKE
jgi:uncharacterized protein (TIGR03000 family)